MKLMPISTKQFIGWTVLITIGFGLLMLTHGKAPFLFNIPVIAASCMSMPASERNRPLSRNQVFAGAGIVLAFVALLWWLTSQFPTGEDSWGRAFLEFTSRPTVAIPVWLLFVMVGILRWRANLTRRELTPQSHVLLSQTERHDS